MVQRNGHSYSHALMVGLPLIFLSCLFILLKPLHGLSCSGYLNMESFFIRCCYYFACAAHRDLSCMKHDILLREIECIIPRAKKGHLLPIPNTLLLDISPKRRGVLLVPKKQQIER